jgi:hypothetical protein
MDGERYRTELIRFRCATVLQDATCRILLAAGKWSGLRRRWGMRQLRPACEGSWVPICELIVDAGCDLEFFDTVSCLPNDAECIGTDPEIYDSCPEAVALGQCLDGL